MRFQTLANLTVAASLLLFDVSTAYAQKSVTDTMTTAPSDTKHLLIIGASYAAGWQQPPLPGFRITNKGVGGEESWQIAARFEKDAIAAKPDAILIWGHINDITRTTPDKYESAKQRAIKSYQQMLAQARAAQIPVMLATEITLPTAVGWRDWVPATLARLRGKESFAETVNREVKAVNAWLRQTAAQEKLFLLDLEAAVDDGSGGRRLEYTQPDRSHVTTAGYDAVTQFALKKMPR
jgi:lysophospholipase L1-like esterase